MRSFIDQWKHARNVGTPIIMVNTLDPASCIGSLTSALNIKKNDKKTVVILWDCVRGVTNVTDAAVNWTLKLKAERPDFWEPELLTNPYEMLDKARQALPFGSIVFFLNIQYFADERNERGVAINQAIWNLRDEFKRNSRTLVLLGPAWSIPTALNQDVTVLDEPLPSEELLRKTITCICRDADLEQPSETIMNKAVDSLRGLSEYAAEQVLVLSLTKDGIDLEALWRNKEKQIEGTPGLSVWKSEGTFADIGGVENVKTFIKAILKGGSAPNVILFIDEIEKALGGIGGDNSGVSQEQLGTMLSWMEDKKIKGMIAIGPPGCAKSAVAKAAGAEAGIPTIRFDLSAMKNALVGRSNANLRMALKVVEAVSGGKILAIATCNSIGNLPPELKRRFTMGTFFFDLPSKEERDIIWQGYMKKLGIAKQTMPYDDGWTGAEIKQCCEIAADLNMSLEEASKFVVPVAKSAAEYIKILRAFAHDRFVSASYSGMYKCLTGTEGVNLEDYTAPVKSRKLQVN